jgi:hypothetical protein
MSAKAHVTYDGQQPTTLKPEKYAYGPAKVVHKATCGNGDPCVLFIAFEDPVDAVPVSSSSH